MGRGTERGYWEGRGLAARFFQKSRSLSLWDSKKMTSHFADTSYFLALLIPNDENHPKAVTVANQSRAAIVTTDWVLVEVGNHLSSTRSRGIFSRFLELLKGDSR